MNRLQAAMRDRAAQGWDDRRMMYRVGSPMKGCFHCGEVEEREIKGGRMRKFYISGFNVFRAYRPWETKWTWKCMDCKSRDLDCWADDALGLVEDQLGKEPQLGARSVLVTRNGKTELVDRAKLAGGKLVLRQQAQDRDKGIVREARNTALPRNRDEGGPSRTEQIEKLQAELDRLKKLLAEKGKR